MTVLSYQSIKRRCIEEALLDPWVERTEGPVEWRGFTVQSGLTLTGGLGPAGYDVHIKQDLFFGQHYDLLRPPHASFQKASTVEHFNMPTDLLGRVCDKSTWARRGMMVQNTIIEPGWDGWLTLELTYHGEDFLAIPAGTPIAQITFELLDEPTLMPYQGKYQHQADRPVEAR